MRGERSKDWCLGMMVVLWVIISCSCQGKKIAEGMHRAKGTQRMQEDLKSCNIFNAHWADQSYPPYDASACPHVCKEFGCQKYGRPNKFYLKFRWQPDDCDLPRHASQRMRGKKIMFVGYSLSLNYWQSLVCLLHAAAPNSTTIHQEATTKSTTTWIFQ
ncbi:hypothetical protein Ancab_009923, partial [Ancistrocladus abbreviatus]